MKKTIVFLLLVIFIGNLLFSFSVSAGDFTGYGGKEIHYEGLVPCGKSTSSLEEMYDDEGNLIKNKEDPEVANACEFCHLFVMLDGIIDFVLIGILPWIVILMILIAGIMFYFAGGNPSLLLQAKKLITSVVIGVTIILCAYLIIGTILTVLGVEHWTTLDQWADGNGVFNVICPIGEGGAAGEDGEEGEEGEEEWDDEKQVTGEYPKCEKEDHLDCDEGQKAENGKCEPGENTNITTNPISKRTDDEKGWYCKFTAEFKPTIGGYLECYVPTGKIYVNCINDPDYVPSIESSSTTDPFGAEEQKLTLNCEDGQTFVEGSGNCIITDPITTSIKNEGPSDNGWFCIFFGTYTAPGGKITIECIETPGSSVGQTEAINKLKDLGVQVYKPCPNENCNDSVADCGEGADKTYVCLNGLPSSIIEKLGQIKEDCDCDVLVTGGTETFGHDDNTPHGYDEAVVDLEDSSGLENWLKNNSDEGGPSWCSPQYGTGYELNDGSAEFCDEGTHFHFELIK